MAEAGMTDLVRVSRRSANMTQSATTGRERHEYVELFTTMAKVTVGSLGSLIPTAKDDPAGGRTTTELRLILYLPTTTPFCMPDDLVEMIEKGPLTDPQITNLRARIFGPIGQSYATARRFALEALVA
jgi:hypothetical protein